MASIDGIEFNSVLEALSASDKRIAELDGRAERLRVALGWFVDDERFRVYVGGNPNVVEPMIAEALRIYGFPELSVNMVSPSCDYNTGTSC